MWKDILKNIQIAGQKTTSRNIASPDEPDECLRKLLNLSEEYLKLQRLINWRYYLDTYLNTGDLAVTSGFKDPIMQEWWPKEFGISENILCFWVKHLSELPDYKTDSYTGRAGKLEGKNKAYFYADYFEREDKGRKCAIIRIRLIYKEPADASDFVYITFSITGPSHKEVRDFIAGAVS